MLFPIMSIYREYYNDQKALPDPISLPRGTCRTPVPPTVHLRSTLAQSPALQILDIRTNADTVGLYEKFELTFDITGTVATNPFFPYDPGLPPGDGGITSNGLFSGPQPCLMVCKPRKRTRQECASSPLPVIKSALPACQKLRRISTRQFAPTHIPAPARAMYPSYSPLHCHNPDGVDQHTTRKRLGKRMIGSAFTVLYKCFALFEKPSPPLFCTIRSVGSVPSEWWQICISPLTKLLGGPVSRDQPHHGFSTITRM